MRSYGQEAHAAAVVTSAPINPGQDLAATSLLDEDEDIPTVVAQPRGPESHPGGPRPAAGAPAWGQATQLMAEGSGQIGAGHLGAQHPQGGQHQQGGPVGGFDSTIALPDSDAAMGIQNKVDQLDRQISHAQAGAPSPVQHVEYQQLPGGPPQGLDAHNQNQAAIETKMSLPRPAAVAQWLMEQGDVEIGGPRSTGVIIAIAALATLCVMGVASLIVYKLRLPPQPDPASMVGGPDGGGADLLPDQDEEFAGSYDATKKKTAKAKLTTRPRRARL